MRKTLLHYMQLWTGDIILWWKSSSSTVRSKLTSRPTNHHRSIYMVKVMVEHGGKGVLQTHDQFGQTPLHRSASGLNCISVLSYLINKGVEVNAIDNQGRTPLTYAMFIGSLCAVSALIEHGADPLMKDRQGHNALHVAIDRRRKAIVGCLLELPIAAQLVVDCDLKSRNPLHVALFHGYAELVPPLVSAIYVFSSATASIPTATTSSISRLPAVTTGHLHYSLTSPPARHSSTRRTRVEAHRSTGQQGTGILSVLSYCSVTVPCPTGVTQGSLPSCLPV